MCAVPAMRVGRCPCGAMQRSISVRFHCPVTSYGQWYYTCLLPQLDHTITAAGHQQPCRLVQPRHAGDGIVVAGHRWDGALVLLRGGLVRIRRVDHGVVRFLAQNHGGWVRWWNGATRQAVRVGMHRIVDHACAWAVGLVVRKTHRRLVHFPVFSTHATQTQPLSTSTLQQQRAHDTAREHESAPTNRHAPRLPGPQPTHRVRRRRLHQVPTPDALVATASQQPHGQALASSHTSPLRRIVRQRHAQPACAG